MRIFQLAILAAAPLILSASPVDFSSSSDSNDTVSFNGTYPGTLVLGADTCFGFQSTCTLSGGQNIGGTFYTFTFSMPNDRTSPFSYEGEPSSITTSGSPVLDFTIADNHGDSASGTYALSNLAGDGGNGVDIDGTISINSLSSSSNRLDTLFGLPSSTALSFVLDVGDCTADRRSVSCIQQTDPTAQFLSLDITPGTPGTSPVPEPGTVGLLSVVSGVMLMALRRRSAKS